MTSPGPTVFENDWQRRFRGFAESFEDDARIAGWSPAGLDTRMRSFARRWTGDRARARWLDAGCGAGTYSRFLAGQNLEVLGIDYSLPSLSKASQRSPASIIWSVADITQLPFETASFHGVLCFGVMQALSGSAPAIQELSRVIKPGGQVWVDALNGWSLLHVEEWLARSMRGRIRRLRYDTPRQLRRVLRESGFDDVRLCWVPVMPKRLMRLQKVLETAAGRRLLEWISPLGALVSHSFMLSARRRHSP